MLPSNRKLASLENQVRNLSTRHYNWLMLGGLGIVIAVLYSPILTAYFISDDYGFLAYLQFYTRDVLNGLRWDEWFIGGIAGYTFFRPVGNLFWLLNYIAFGLNPFGHHVTIVLFHLLSSYIVSCLGYLLSHNRRVASASALLFAVMPVHAEAVSWVAAAYDPISGLLYLVSLFFYVLYRRKGMLRWYLTAFVAFVAALSTKETALTFPVMILLYDVLFESHAGLAIRELVQGHAPYWIIVGIRLMAFGHGYSGIQLTGVNWWPWMDGLLLRLANPLFAEISTTARWILLVGIVLLVWVYRARPEVVYGVLWILLTFVPTIIGGLSDRSFYIPSFGLSIVLASVLIQPRLRLGRKLNVVTITALLVLPMTYCQSLVVTNQTIRRAGDVAETILKQIVTLHPTPSPDERLIFVGLPDQVPGGPLVFLTGFRAALQVSYQSKAPNPFKLGKFPIWFDDLDKTFFFEVNHRKVAKRADLIQSLKERVQCENYSAPFLEWNFSASPLDWEAWNQLNEFAVREGALTMRAEGNDPIMASPPIDLPPLAIGEIQLAMRVRAAQPTLQGELYWLASSQSDFSPGLKSAFPVLADGEWHTYRVDIARSGMLLLGDRITQIRLDPTDAPAHIAIQSITISTHCSSWQNERCICAPQ